LGKSEAWNSAVLERHVSWAFSSLWSVKVSRWKIWQLGIVICKACIRLFQTQSGCSRKMYTYITCWPLEGKHEYFLTKEGFERTCDVLCKITRANIVFKIWVWEMNEQWCMWERVVLFAQKQESWENPSVVLYHYLHVLLFLNGHRPLPRDRTVQLDATHC
jgi:hypothetical protein